MGSPTPRRLGAEAIFRRDRARAIPDRFADHWTTYGCVPSEAAILNVEKPGCASAETRETRPVDVGRQVPRSVRVAARPGFCERWTGVRARHTTGSGECSAADCGTVWSSGRCVAASSLSGCRSRSLLKGRRRLATCPCVRVAGSVALAPVTFSYTGREQTYTVPVGVTGVEVEAVGANGANSFGPSPALGGTGGMVIGELAVGGDAAIAPGDTLYVAVGSTFRGDRLGGFNGGGRGGGFSPGGTGRGGGGATDVRTCSRAATSCPNGDPSALTRLIVAAGGGGAGGCFQQSDCEFFAGAGGSAGGPGDGLPGTGGGAGTLVAPGAGGRGALASGTSGGVDGSGGQGATQPNGGLGKLGGGGGGGGYTGGGGGGIGIAPNGDAYVGAGGGGGANFASPLASSVTFGLGDGKPRLVITRGRRPRSASAGSSTTRPVRTPAATGAITANGSGSGTLAGPAGSCAAGGSATPKGMSIASGGWHCGPAHRSPSTPVVAAAHQGPLLEPPRLRVGQPARSRPLAQSRQHAGRPMPLRQRPRQPAQMLRPVRGTATRSGRSGRRLRAPRAFADDSAIAR